MERNGSLLIKMGRNVGLRGQVGQVKLGRHTCSIPDTFSKDIGISVYLLTPMTKIGKRCTWYLKGISV